MRIGVGHGRSRRSSRFVALRTSPSSQRVSQKFARPCSASSCSCARRYASSAPRCSASTASASSHRRTAVSGSVGASVAARAGDRVGAARERRRSRPRPARARRRRARASSAGGTSPRTSPRSRARSSRRGRTPRRESSCSGSVISRIAVHTSWPSFIAATVASCTYCTASRMRSHSERTSRRAAHRTVVAEQQHLGLEVDDALHRLDERERAAHAVAAHRHEVREVAEQRGEHVADERDASSGSHTTSESIVSPPGTLMQLDPPAAARRTRRCRRR